MSEVMPEPRTAVMILVEASWADQSGTLQTVSAQMVNQSSMGACIRVRTRVRVGTRMRIQWRWEEFTGITKNIAGAMERSIEWVCSGTPRRICFVKRNVTAGVPGGPDVPTRESMKKVESAVLGIPVNEPKWKTVPKVATVNREERAALSVAEVEMAIGASVGNSIGSSPATAVLMPEIRQIEIPPSVSMPLSIPLVSGQVLQRTFYQAFRRAHRQGFLKCKKPPRHRRSRRNSKWYSNLLRRKLARKGNVCKPNGSIGGTRKKVQMEAETAISTARVCTANLRQGQVRLRKRRLR